MFMDFVKFTGTIKRPIIVLLNVWIFQYQIYEEQIYFKGTINYTFCNDRKTNPG